MRRYAPPHDLELMFRIHVHIDTTYDDIARMSGVRKRDVIAYCEGKLALCALDRRSLTHAILKRYRHVGQAHEIPVQGFEGRVPLTPEQVEDAMDFLDRECDDEIAELVKRN